LVSNYKNHEWIVFLEYLNGFTYKNREKIVKNIYYSRFICKNREKVYNKVMKKSRIQKIAKLRKRYYEAFKKNGGVVELINSAEISENVYNSNAIENSTLTLEETDKILLEIDLDRYISQREVFEAKNLARVMEYINNNAKEKELNHEIILFLHKMLIANINDDIAGRFRRGNELVRVGRHIAPIPAEIEERLINTFSEYLATSAKNIVERVARLHLEFEYTHPFIDGNGRIGRVINNYLFIKEGYVPINIKFINRAEYYDAFKEFDANGSIEKMEEIVYKALLNSYHKRLAYLESKKIMKLSDYAKQEKISHSNLLNKAGRQTIEAFLENDTWKIGVDIVKNKND